MKMKESALKKPVTGWIVPKCEKMDLTLKQQSDFNE